jgi:ribosome maturation factor RimP
VDFWVAVSSTLRQRLIELAEPLVEQLGYELIDIEYAPGRSQGLVRLYIDKPGGVPGGAAPEVDVDDASMQESGIGVEDCERVSREFSALMDVEDPVPTAYTLEVSSPGADRILRKPAHYARFAGERVHVELLIARDGRRRYTGLLQKVAEKGIELEVDGQPVVMTFEEIAKARLSPDWSKPRARR